MTHGIILIALMLMPLTAQVNGEENGLARLSVTPVPYSLARSATVFEVFGPLEHLTVDVRIGNEDPLRTLVLAPGFFEAIRWRLEAVRTEPLAGSSVEPVVLSVRRVEPVTCGPSPAVCDSRSRTLIDPDGWVRARVLLRPTAGVLDPGEYRLMVDGSPARQHLRETNDGPWTGRFIERGSIPLVIRELKTAEDRAKYHRVEAAAAMKRDDYSAALAHYRQMAEASPGDSAAQAGIGWALLDLGRFQEAARVLERLWFPNQNRFAGAKLAVAYEALGRRRESEMVLKQLYGPDQAQQGLEEVRLAAKTLKARRQ